MKHIISRIGQVAIYLTAFSAATSGIAAAPQPLPSPPHTFQSPRPGWIKQISYLTAQPDDEGWVSVSPAKRDPKVKDYHVEYRYFENKQDCKTGKFCKVLQYDPTGHLEEDNEVIGNDQYVRTLYVNGSLASYVHYRLRSQYFARTIDGFAISPVKKMVSRFDHGSGDLTVWKDTEGTFTRTWYLNGGAYLEKMYVRGVCDYVQLDNTVCPAEKDFGDIYMWTPTQEQLLTQNEMWIKAKAHGPSAILHGPSATLLDQSPSSDPVKQRIRQVSTPIFNFRPGQASRQPIYDQLAKDYVARRAQFFANYDKLLAMAGKNTKSLGLQDTVNFR